MKNRLPLFSASGLAVLGCWITACAAGCAPSEPTTTIANTTATKEQMAKRIEDEKFMPPDQKAAALARLGVRPVIDAKMVKH